MTRPSPSTIADLLVAEANSIEQRMQDLIRSGQWQVMTNEEQAFFAEILHELARTVTRLPLADTAHRDALRDAAKALYRALGENAKEPEE
jgi:glucuronate isomerase